MGKDVIDFNHDDDQRHQHRAGDRGDQLAAFGDVDEFKASVDTLVRDLRGTSACRASTASGSPANAATKPASHAPATASRSRRR